MPAVTGYDTIPAAKVQGNKSVSQIWQALKKKTHTHISSYSFCQEFKSLFLPLQSS